MFMRGIVTPETAAYMKAIVDGSIETDPIEFIRCVDERAYNTLTEICSTMVNRSASEIQMAFLGNQITVSEQLSQELQNTMTASIAKSLAYGWILNHLARLAIDLKKVPNLSSYVSAAIDSEGDLKKLRANLSVKKTAVAITPEEENFNEFLNTLKDTE